MRLIVITMVHDDSPRPLDPRVAAGDALTTVAIEDNIPQPAEACSTVLAGTGGPPLRRLALSASFAVQSFTVPLTVAPLSFSGLLVCHSVSVP